jgi:hypothetical protein
MKPRVKFLIALVAALVIVGLVAPMVSAQCSPARSVKMRQDGKTNGRIGVDTAGEITLLNNGTEKASLWVLGSALTNNSCGPQFQAALKCPAGITTDTCNSQTGVQGTPWWLAGQTGTSQPPTAMSISVWIGGTGCTIPQCPSDGAVVSTLVEDVTADGTDAGFCTYSADDTPADALRYYDLSRSDPATQPSNDATHIMHAFPTVNTRNSAGPPPNTTVSNDYRDQGNPTTKNVWIVDSGSFLPTQILTSYDIYWFHGGADPGRVRTNWTYLSSAQYTGGPITADSVTVPCPTEVDDTYLAVGLSFDGAYAGTDTLPTGSIQTYYVGKSTAVECDPTLADPDAPSIDRQKKHFGRQPTGRRGR